MIFDILFRMELWPRSQRHPPLISANIQLIAEDLGMTLDYGEIVDRQTLGSMSIQRELTIDMSIP
jgi:hypothetical protein